MAAPAYRFPDFWTEADLEALPDDGHRYEIINGSLVMTPPPTDGHQSIGVQLLLALRNAAPPGWRVLYELGVRIPSGNLIPDLVVLYPHAAREVDWRDPRDVALVVEVASPSTEDYDRTIKVLKYAQAGIPAYWRVARDGTVTVYALVAEAQYGIIATVKPGTTWKATFPFEVTLNPDALVADL